MLLAAVSAPDRVTSRSYSQMQMLAYENLIRMLDCQEVQSMLGIYRTIRKKIADENAILN